MQIDNNFSKMRRQVDALEGLSAELKKLADVKMQRAMQELSQGWKGESAAAFLLKYEQLQEELRENARQLKVSAEQLSERERFLYEAEMRAAEAARMLGNK